jgi:hydrogenase expression/formation protein HypC
MPIQTDSCALFWKTIIYWRNEMCLAIPVLIQEIDGSEALVEIGGVKRKISLVLTPETKVGQYVIIHAGYAIGVLDEEEARETLKLLEEMAAYAEEPEDSKGSNPP